jgi:hypothetical protein
MALTWDQVSAITKRTFIKKAEDNFFDSNPYFERMKSKNIMKKDGGRSIMAPLMYDDLSANQWYSGSDALDVSDNETITGAEYQWRYHNVSIVIKRTDELQNMGDAQVLSLVAEKTKGAEKTMADVYGTALWNDGSVSNQLHGLRHILSASNTVGGIDQSTNAWWASNLDSSTTTMTLSALQTQYNAAAIGNDKPTVSYTTRTLFNSYWNLLQPQQRFQDSRTASAGFSSLLLNGMPVIVDSHCPANHLAMLNENYMKLVVHKDEWMRFEDFVKPVNQNVRIAHLYSAAQQISNNNRMHALFTAMTA